MGVTWGCHVGHGGGSSVLPGPGAEAGLVNPCLAARHRAQARAPGVRGPGLATCVSARVAGDPWRAVRVDEPTVRDGACRGGLQCDLATNVGKDVPPCTSGRTRRSGPVAPDGARKHVPRAAAGAQVCARRICRQQMHAAVQPHTAAVAHDRTKTTPGRFAASGTRKHRNS